MFIEFINQNLLLVLAFVVVLNLLVFTSLNTKVRGANQVSALHLPQLQRSAKSLIIDVSESANFDTAHIADAVNMPLRTFTDKSFTLSKELIKQQEKTTILVCQTGSKSAKAAKILVSNGFTDLHILSGGMSGWSKENLPTVSV